MKKSLLLLSAAFIAFAGFAQDEDITPSNYYFNNCTKLPFHETIFSGSNHDAGTWASIDGANKWDNGLITMVIFNNNATHTQNFPQGVQLVNLGGEVGNVFCFAANQSNINQVLLDATGFDYGIKAVPAGGPFFKMNFFLHPDGTPTASEGNIKVKVLYNLYYPDFQTETSKPLVQRAYMKGDAGNSFGAATENAAALPLKGCSQLDDDTEEDIYDPTMWRTYEFVVTCPDADDNGGAYVPAYLNFEFNNWLPGAALFIKEITFHKTTDAATYGERKSETFVLAPGNPSTTGIANVVADEAAAYSVNGNTVNFAAPAVVFNLTGAQVAAGTEATLAAGIYVARVGEKAVKFAVK